MDVEVVFLGQLGNCAKWERQGCVGSRGPFAHVSLWTDLWNRWRLLGDSVTVHWAPSHVQAFRAVLRDREVRDIWSNLGLEEMDDPSDDDINGGHKMGRSRTVISQMIRTVVRRLFLMAVAKGRQWRVPCRCIKDKSLGSEGGGRANPSQPKNHSIACGQTQGNI